MIVNGKQFPQHVSLLVLLSGILIALPGCDRPQSPFQTVQVCVENQQGLELLKMELQTIASSDNMQLHDASKSTEADLKTMNYPNQERTLGSPVVNIQLFQADGFGVGVGNLSLPGYQLALSFTAGDDETAARDFAAKLIANLERHWPVYIVPEGRSAFPTEGCQ